MKTFTKLVCQLLVFVCLAVNGNAQHFMGLATSDYSAMNSIYLNPASIADCNEKVVVNLSGVGFGFDNNLGTFSSFTTIIKKRG